MITFSKFNSDLAYNQIDNITSNFFSYTTSLKTLYAFFSASHEGFSSSFSPTFSPLIFWCASATFFLSPLPQCRFLGINRISQLDEQLFRNTTLLEHIDLGSNKIVQLPQSIFSALSWLTHLNIYKNRLVSLPRLDSLSRLEQLLLDDNRLSGTVKILSHQT